MNYFAHYFFDRQLENYRYNFGLLAPDLLRNYSKNQYSKNAVHQSFQRTDDYSRGMAQHINRDAIFHDSIFFKQVYSKVHDQAKEAFIRSEIPRFWFGTHVMIEMILDAVLIKKYPEALTEMYYDLEKSMSCIDELLILVEHQNKNHFKAGLRKFLESKFLFKYHSDGLIYGLNKVYQQVGAETKEWNQSIPLLELSETIQISITEHLGELTK